MAACIATVRLLHAPAPMTVRITKVILRSLLERLLGLIDDLVQAGGALLGG